MDSTQSALLFQTWMNSVVHNVIAHPLLPVAQLLRMGPEPLHIISKSIYLLHISTSLRQGKKQ